MNTKNAKAVGKTLESIATRQDDDQELVYDPRSGTLEVVKKGEVMEDSDRVPATEMAREGFFSWTKR
jgi:hypothetical protein